jgi:FlaA1/EpsC-like NDP-sugar epimerase
MDNFSEKNILITGGAGSVGRNLAKRFLKKDSKPVRILDNDEPRLSQVKSEINDDKARFLLGDIRDKDRLSRAMENVDVVVHTAAMKHVDISEYNPFEAVKTNIVGLQNVVDCAINNDVEDLVFTSSDKAVHPRNTMGATKLVGEKLFSAGNVHKGERDTTFSSVRFGNVINSSQSVVPLFKKQIRGEGKIRLTSRNMTRFFLTFDQVSELIKDALYHASGGEIFLKKMDAIRIEDLAEAMIEMYAPEYGRAPENVEIEIMGKRPGETFHEHIMTEEEAARAKENDNMYAIPPDSSTGDMLNPTEIDGFEDAEEVVISSEKEEKLSQKEIKELLGD